MTIVDYSTLENALVRARVELIAGYTVRIVTHDTLTLRVYRVVIE